METIWGHAAQVPFSANPNPGMWMYGDTLARLARLAPGVLHADLSACNAYAGGMEAAAKVKCPALFVLGARDVMTPPRAAQELAKAICELEIGDVEPLGPLADGRGARRNAGRADRLLSDDVPDVADVVARALTRMKRVGRARDPTRSAARPVRRCTTRR
jgi:hypothetical protein